LPSNLINKRTDIMRLNSNQFQFLGTNKIGPGRGVTDSYMGLLRKDLIITWQTA